MNLSEGAVGETVDSWMARRQLWGTGARAPHPGIPTISFLVHFGVNMIVVCEISWCRCQQVTALSISTAVVTKLSVIEQLLHPAMKFVTKFTTLPLLATNPWRRHCMTPVKSSARSARWVVSPPLPVGQFIEQRLFISGPTAKCPIECQAGPGTSRTWPLHTVCIVSSMTSSLRHVAIPVCGCFCCRDTVRSRTLVLEPCMNTVNQP